MAHPESEIIGLGLMLGTKLTPAKQRCSCVTLGISNFFTGEQEIAVFKGAAQTVALYAVFKEFVFTFQTWALYDLHQNI